MIWPRKNETNVRTFTKEQIQAGKQVISLQYGSNKGASQAGMNFGKTRTILDWRHFWWNYDVFQGQINGSRQDD